MNEDRFWLLVSLKLTDEADAAELQELERLLREHPEWGMKAEMLQGIWASRPDSSVFPGAFDRHMQRLSNHLSEPVLQYEEDTTVAVMEEIGTASRVSSLRRIGYWLTGIAACLLIGFIYFSSRNGAEGRDATAKNAVTTKPGSKSNIQLPDGTQVWLNADSKLTYNEKFQGDIREVSLSGEAYFDVVRDESRPFIIHTKAIDVRVLGTSFNVRSYENEKITETSLIHGSVEITLRNRPDKKIVLKPNEKLIVQNDEDPSAVMPEAPSRKQQLTLDHINFQKKDSSIIETLWVKNKLAFDGEAFEDIALKIERWFDVKVDIRGEKLKATPFSAVFDGESLQEVLEALRISGNFRYTIDRKQVTIFP